MRKILVVGATALVVFLVMPGVVGAITAPDALLGLKEYFSLLLGLAEKGLVGYSKFLEALKP